MMKKALLAAVVVASVGVGYAVHAQVAQRQYRNGTVWELSFIKVEPGMDAAYLNFVATQWKQQQEALKKEGIILSYKVLSTEDHGVDDWNLILMTEAKSFTAWEASEDKAEALMQQLGGGDQKMQQGMIDRAKLRRIIGNRIAREIVLSPKPGA